MKDLAEFLAPFPPEKHGAIRRMLRRAETRALAAYRLPDGARLVTIVKIDGPDAEETRTDGGKLVAYYAKPVSKVRAAIRYMQDNPGTQPATAARLHGISSQAIHITLDRERARQRRAGERPTCPCCGQPIPETTE